MKEIVNRLWLSVGTTLLVLSVNTFAAEDATTLDLRKFEAEARAGIEATYGRNAIKAGSGRILFQDGAASVDLPPLFDIASINYVVEMKPGVLPAGNSLLSYRLLLNGGHTGLMLVQPSGDAQSLVFYAANAGVVIYKQSTSDSERLQLLRKIRAASAGIKIVEFGALGMLQYEVNPNDAAKIARIFATSAIVETVELAAENYRLPFDFGQPVLLSTRDGKVNVDQYRTVTRYYKEQNLPFTSETFVPQRLR